MNGAEMRKVNWQKKADEMWSKVIKQVGHCERCFATDKQLHSHHIIGRKAFAYRHDVSNGVCLCASCHTMSAWSAHNDRSEFLYWLKHCRPGQWKWFLEHTVRIKKKIGLQTFTVYHSKPGEHKGDKLEYEELKEMYKMKCGKE